MTKLFISLVLSTMLTQEVEFYKAQNEHDYAVQYVFQQPVANPELTYYEKMKLFEMIAE